VKKPPSVPWVWLLIVAGVVAVNLYMASPGNSVLPTVFHYGVAGLSVIFGIVLVVASQRTSRAWQKLSALGLSEEEIGQLMKADDVEAAARELLEARNA
jgi:hypothetical protein